MNDSFFFPPIVDKATEVCVQLEILNIDSFNEMSMVSVCFNIYCKGVHTFCDNDFLKYWYAVQIYLFK